MVDSQSGTPKKGETWFKESTPGLEAHPGEAVFAASNSALSLDEATVVRFGTGGHTGGRVLVAEDTSQNGHWTAQQTPIQHNSESAGIFSMDFRTYDSKDREIDDDRWVAVGGDYLKPNSSTDTAVYTLDSGKHWQKSVLPPHGYRSAAAFYEPKDTWITIGPNGTDTSTDNGRNWRPLKPSPTDPPDADQHFNALSLPYAVGPHGRIATLQPNRLK